DIPHASFVLFFSLMLPSPPTSPLFPYPALFRSFTFDFTAHGTPPRAVADRLPAHGVYGAARWIYAIYVTSRYRQLVPVAATPRRSEEHTSELQSRFDLVCRLLLEKKKTKHNLRL